MPEDEKLGCLYSGVCLLFPYVGFFIWVTVKGDRPLMAKDAIKWSVAGSILYGVILLIAGLIALFIIFKTAGV
jgi:hypothetical protein